MPAKFSGLRVEPGDVMAFYGPSGGGYGDPLDRSAEKVLEDVLDGFYTAEAARSTFGVVVDLEAERVDEAATEAARRELRARPAEERAGDGGDGPRAGRCGRVRTAWLRRGAPGTGHALRRILPPAPTALRRAVPPVPTDAPARRRILPRTSGDGPAPPPLPLPLRAMAGGRRRLHRRTCRSRHRPSSRPRGRWRRRAPGTARPDRTERAERHRPLPERPLRRGLELRDRRLPLGRRRGGGDRPAPGERKLRPADRPRERRRQRPRRAAQARERRLPPGLRRRPRSPPLSASDPRARAMDGTTMARQVDGLHGREMERVFIYWDNSNIFISARDVAVEREGAAVRQLRVHFRNLLELAHAGARSSTRSPSDPFAPS